MSRPKPTAPAAVYSSGGTPAEEELLGYQRSPVDLLRVCIFAVIAAALIVVMLLVQDSVVRLEGDAVRFLDRLPGTIERIIHGSLEWLGFVVIGAIVLVPLVTKRFRLFGYVFVADVFAIGAMALVLHFVDRSTPKAIVAQLTARDGITVATTSGALGIAVWTASFIVLGPFVVSRWRRAANIGITVLVVIRLFVSYNLPGTLIMALPSGATIGAAVLYAFGRPDRRPSAARITKALVNDGLAVRQLSILATDTPGSTRCEAVLEDGSQLHVRVSGEERRAADLLNRLYRFIRYKHAGDDRPFASLEQSIEHEALMAYVARDAGVRTPGVRAVAPTGLDSVLIAYDRVEGCRIDELDAGTLGDAALDDAGVRDAFAQLAAMRGRRVAHRRVGQSTLIVGAEGSVSLVDFAFGTLAADDSLLAGDVAQALVAIALIAGAKRTTPIAIDVLGSDAVVAALPRLQPQALAQPTREALRRHKGLLDDLQRQIREATDVEDVQLAQLERVDKKTVLMLVVLAAATYAMLPQIANVPKMVQRLGEANWWWMPVIATFTAVTYVGGAAGLAGAVPIRLRPGPLTVSQLAASFTGTLAPAGVGGMALSARFLQKQGVDKAVAVSAVGLTTVAGFLVHMSMLAIFVIWAGRRAFRGVSLPKPESLLIGLAVVAVLAGLALLVPATRRLLRERVWPTIKRSADGVSDVVRRPAKMLELFGGSALVTFGNMFALYFAVVALGGGLPLASIGAVYLIGASVASVAPTPGGMGAIEAALVSGLVAAGLTNAAAVPAVILFRLITFWLPNLPGWIGFRWLQRHEYI
ncbi:MAG: flippase-like domain-containing protein [Candidatus Microthrix sp.]|uniref:Flippase-like domain-containing protein n=1 Tax=Candidatus Neomicrothrix subdominans TaxID=2954438 RepID=A0A936N868_9ACTN|nr:flippase-like domain-containing protein [Candidatus Microthrix subdominans]